MNGLLYWALLCSGASAGILAMAMLMINRPSTRDLEALLREARDQVRGDLRVKIDRALGDL